MNEVVLRAYELEYGFGVYHTLLCGDEIPDCSAFHLTETQKEMIINDCGYSW